MLEHSSSETDDESPAAGLCPVEEAVEVGRTVHAIGGPAEGRVAELLEPADARNRCAKTRS
jgi:hypothetical protein